MGLVFLAEDVELRRQVALKVMRAELAQDAAARERFLREARAMAAVKHDHVATIYHAGQENGLAFLAMEYLEGESLDRWLARGARPTLSQVLRLGRETALGLAAAHDRGLVHRDVKPGNLWLEAPDGRVKVLDFGLARAAADPAHLTRTGAIVGTPAYMAPEQARGQPTDHRGDLFSLGCVLYRLCTGRLPFPGNDTLAVLSALALDDPPHPVRLNPQLPPALAELVMCLLAKRPSDRPPSARDVVERIRAIERNLSDPALPPTVSAAALPASPADHTDVLESPPAAKVTPRPSRALPTLALGLVGLVLAANCVLFTVLTRQGGTPSTPHSRQVTQHNPGPAGLRRPPPVIDEAWSEAVKAMPPQKQVGAVAAKLRELNPDFDGTVTPTIEENAVVKVVFAPDQVTDLSPLRALPRLKMIHCFSTAGPDARARLADLRPLQGLPLENLHLAGTSVADLTPLKDMKALGYLGCGQTGVADLTPLAGLSLMTLRVEGTRVADLTPLAGMPLHDLDVSKTGVRDLSLLKDATLQYLNISETEVSDLSVLAGKQTTHLWASKAPIADLSPLRGHPLKMLHLDGTKVADLSPLRGIPLTELWLRGAPVRDFSPLRGLPLQALEADLDPRRDGPVVRSLKDLKALNGQPPAEFLARAEQAEKEFDAWVEQTAALKGDEQMKAVALKLKELNPGFEGNLTPVVEDGVVPPLDFFTDDVTDLAPLRALRGLKVLTCRGSGEGKGKLADLSPLAGLKLAKFDASFNRIADLSPLQGMPLEELLISCNQVTDLTPLRGMKLDNLGCGNNPVSDLSPLRGQPLRGLSIGGTRVTNLAPLKDVPLKYLYADVDPARDGVLRAIPTLEKINGKFTADFWKDAGKP
jgi:serine/threonine protein kinase/Leucine-rich repeat (LRR) protein